MLDEQILVERMDGFAVVTMNKPSRRNALGTDSMAALEMTLATLAEEGFAAAVLTGAPPAFCAGSDLKELGGLSIAEMRRHEAETARIARGIAHLPMAVIAAVEGYALGGGVTIATACDIVVSARGAKWNMPEVRNGWLPPWGLRTILARVGPVKAQIVTWGIMAIDGEEAARIGLADLAVDDGTALAEARILAERLAALPREAVRSTKRFFSHAIAGDAEWMDAEASRLFGEDCEGPVAKATFAKFTVSK